MNEFKKNVKDPAVVKQFEAFLQNPTASVEKLKALYKDVDLKQLASQMKDDIARIQSGNFFLAFLSLHEVMRFIFLFLDAKRVNFLQNVLDDKVVPTAQNVAEIIGSDAKTVEESIAADLPKYVLDQDYFKKYESKLTPDLRSELQKLEKLIIKETP